MDSMTFLQAVKDLTSFYPQFRLKNEQADAWFQRLKGFDNDSLLDAVFWLTENRATAPGYLDLKNAIIEASNRIYSKTRVGFTASKEHTKRYLKYMRNRGMVPVFVENTRAWTFEPIDSCYIDTNEPWCLLEGFKVNRFKLKENSSGYRPYDPQQVASHIAREKTMPKPEAIDYHDKYDY